MEERDEEGRWKVKRRRGKSTEEDIQDARIYGS